MIPPRASGTMSFCAQCPASANCCTRVSHGSTIENPFVFDGELADLEELSGKPFTEFTVDRISLNGGRHKSLAANRAGCVFLVGGRCSVYQARPLDCRLFPFDLLRGDDGTVFWIVYTSLCPVEFDFEDHFASVKVMFESAKLSVSEIEIYVESDAKGMVQNEYRILEPLALRKQ